jgi:cyclopropane fatty-acyl-phospholipid synthase-like methyltransferase
MSRISIPPPAVHTRVTGKAFSAAGYKHHSKALAQGVDSVMAAHGLRMDQFKSVLDFGCGCGRVLSHYVHLAGEIEFCGTDIDEVAIDWCQQNIPGMQFSLNGASPPLRWPDWYFDFIMVVSVFTHIPWKMQIDWLKELKRVLRPGGYLLATTFGDVEAEKHLQGASLKAYRDTGYCYVRNISDGVFPDWYQSTFLGPDYVYRVFGSIFEHVVHQARGLCDFQDAVILRRD